MKPNLVRREIYDLTQKTAQLWKELSRVRTHLRWTGRVGALAALAVGLGLHHLKEIHHQAVFSGAIPDMPTCPYLESQANSSLPSVGQSLGSQASLQSVEREREQSPLPSGLR